MGKTLFNSTLDEKKTLLAKLKVAPVHTEVKIAMRVVEDAKMLHEMHQLMMNVQYDLMALVNARDTNIAEKYIKRNLENIADFYERIERRKKKTI